jgi:hypothetical protein
MAESKKLEAEAELPKRSNIIDAQNRVYVPTDDTSHLSNRRYKRQSPDPSMRE